MSTLSQNYWIWVFGEIQALRWVCEHNTMAFGAHATKVLTRARPGDQALLYVTQGARHRPNRDVSRLAGLASIVTEPAATQGELVVAGRQFSWSCAIQVDILLPENTGPVIADLVDQLDLVTKANAWGAYFHRSPILINEHDFRVLAGALERFTKRTDIVPQRGVFPDLSKPTHVSGPHVINAG